jgi:hypothetical protein
MVRPCETIYWPLRRRPNRPQEINAAASNPIDVGSGTMLRRTVKLLQRERPLNGCRISNLSERKSGGFASGMKPCTKKRGRVGDP